MSQQLPEPVTTPAGLPADFQTLQQVELDVLKSLDIAASTIEELAKVDGADRPTLERLVADFLDTVKVHDCAAAQVITGLTVRCTQAA